MSETEEVAKALCEETVALLHAAAGNLHKASKAIMEAGVPAGGDALRAFNMIHDGLVSTVRVAANIKLVYP